MIAETICHWCLCILIHHQIIDCQRCGSGPKEDLSQFVLSMNTPGELLNAECYPKGGEPEVDWMSKKVAK